MSSEEQQIVFAELLRTHHARLFGFVRSLVINATDAQDVFQETVLALWQQHESFDPQRDFGGWAFGIARHKVFDHYKSQRQLKARLGEEVLRQLADRQEQSPETTELLQARQAALGACLDTLTESQSELLHRCYGGGETVRDVAASLKRTTGSVYSSLRHIRMGLLECIKHRLDKEANHV